MLEAWLASRLLALKNNSGANFQLLSAEPIPSIKIGTYSVL